MPAPRKFQKPDRDEEHHRPAMRERVGVTGLLARAQLQERPRLDRQEGQRNDLGRREERAQRHVLHRRAGEVQMVHGADDAAGGIQDDVEEDHAQRDSFAHHAQQHEHVGHHHGGEQFEEVLDPQVHHPEPPEVGDGVVGVAAGQQPDGVERRDRQPGEEEQPRHVHLRLALEPGAHAAPDDRDPHEQARRSAGSATAAAGRGTPTAGRTGRPRGSPRRWTAPRRSASRTPPPRPRPAARTPAALDVSARGGR